MLQILVCFSSSNVRNTQKIFREEFDKMFSEHFSFFTESHFTMCHISDTNLLLCIDLSVSYSMLFASKIAEISKGIENMYVQSVNYSI